MSDQPVIKTSDPIALMVVGWAPSSALDAADMLRRVAQEFAGRAVTGVELNADDILTLALIAERGSTSGWVGNARNSLLRNS